jgi:hypothetical protein
MTRSPISFVLGLLVATSLVLVMGWTTSALAPDEGPPATPSARSTTTPLLDALAFAPRGIYSFDFTDWTALKALHGGAGLTSASPLEERQRLVLDMANSETSASGFGLDRLSTWPELWGWDNTDLAWEATPWDPVAESATVLRFRDGWDPGQFIDRLEVLGYSRTEQRYGILFSDSPDFMPDPDAEAVLDADELLLTAGPHSVAISKDGRTVAIREGSRADELLRIAARADPAEVAASPFGRAAAALGRPVAATIVDGAAGCSWMDLADLDYSEDMTTLARSVGPLHPYQALAMGYERAGPGEPAMGRYAFAYTRAQQAATDLEGRRTLIDDGYSSRHDGKGYRDVAFTLIDAQVVGRTLVFDVVPLYDNPKVFHDLFVGRSLAFASCGP